MSIFYVLSSKSQSLVKLGYKMSEVLSVDCELKEKNGKSVARSLRRESRVPVNIYGKDFKNISGSITAKAADAICNKFTAKTSLVEIKTGKEKHVVLAKEICLHPVTDQIMHVDFVCIKNAKQLKVDVPIKVLGRDSSPGIKRGGVVNMTTRFLTSKVHKDTIPSFIEVDISEMSIGDTLRLKDLKIPSEITTLEKDPKKTIMKLVGKKAKAEEASSTEGAESVESAAEGGETSEEAKK